MTKVCSKWILLTLLAVGFSACSGRSLSEYSSASRNEIPGGKAGGFDASLLAAAHAVSSSRPPAAIRPDPDTYIRTLLRQYRDEGPTIAREIGRVEDYRLLLGGATEDFSKPPQQTYDATSLLAVQKVAEEICEALIAPNASSHGDWKTILPAAPSDSEANLRFLAQRFLGKPSQEIDGRIVDELREILMLSAEEGQLTEASYIHVCVALSVDGEALLL